MRPKEPEQRSADRFETALPVAIGGSHGQTQNISATGVYFESDVRQHVGALVNFTVEFTLHGERHRLSCEGKVVRVDEQGDRVGVAAELVAPLFGETESVVGKPAGAG